MSGRPGPSGRSASSPTGGPSTPPEATSPSCPAISPEGPTDSRCAGARPFSLEQQRHRGLVHRQAPPNAGARPRTGLHSRPTPALRNLTEAEMATRTRSSFACLLWFGLVLRLADYVRCTFSIPARNLSSRTCARFIDCVCRYESCFLFICLFIHFFVL